MFHDFGRHAHPGVGDRQADIRSRGRAQVHPGVGDVQSDVRGCEGQPSPIRHRIPSVHRQIDDHLLELGAVGHGQALLRILVHHQLHVFADQPAEHRGQAVEYVVEAQQLGLHHLATAEGQ